MCNLLLLRLPHAPSPGVTISPTPATVRARSPATVRAPSPAQASAPPTPTSSTATIAKELEQKLFVTETALAPPAAEAAAAAAASQAGRSAAEKAPVVDLAPVSKKGLAHPARPGAGTAGKMIRANHFLVNVTDNNLFHYDVSINPESKSRQTNREVLSELIKIHGKTSLGGKLPAYDGRKSLYNAGSLPFESEEFTVTLVDPEKKDKERAEREYKITIRIAGRTDLYHLQQFLCGRQRDMPQETIQVLDVVLRESPSWNYVTVSRSFFSTTYGHRGDIGEGSECWRDISATSFFKPVTVIQFVQEFLNLRDVSRPLNDRDRVKIKKALRGVRVETNHQTDQIRRYKITGLTNVPMSQLIFPVDDRGTRMSVVQYFFDRYDYKLQHTNWPCLQSGSDSRPVYLPMEACKIEEGQRYSKKLNDKQVTNIFRATCQRPQQREQSIREMVLHNKYAEDKFAHEFGIKVCSDLALVPARVLPPPMLRYHDSGREKTCAPSVGQWNMINKSVCPRPVLDIRTATPNNIENALRDVHRRTAELIAQQGKGGQLQLLVVIVPEVTGSYGKMKGVCENDLGIVSVLPAKACFQTKQAISGKCCTQNQREEITKYRGLVSAQPHRHEIIEDLFSVTKDPKKGTVNGGMIRDLLIAFRRKTGRRPERIIFYRDGVSEGQFSHVLLHEMDALRKACASLEEGYLPPVTFVVVQKIHHTRLFSEAHAKREMTAAGTVVGIMICHNPTEFGYYLCSHAGIQGTSRPTHYHVLYDENHFTADALQSLTNNLCYT
ncbi:hypothetical protein ACQ4PT_002411 [Festuca glaucescens]